MCCFEPPFQNRDDVISGGLCESSPRSCSRLLALLLTVSPKAQAPQPAPATFNPQDVIPFDAAVRRGTLPNGLTYFIRRNARPEKRVSLRLAVKAGSLYEADDQQGLAHLIEHMAFNGSAHFKPGELVLVLRVDRRAARTARQRLYELRRDRLHARAADRQRRDRDARVHGAGRLRRRPVARCRPDRQGARRRHRRVARAARRRAAHPGQAAAADVLRLALRRAAADRQAGNPADRAGRASSRVLRHVVSARTAWRSSRSAISTPHRPKQTIRSAFGPIAARAPAATAAERAGAAALRSCSSTSRPIPS